MLLMWTELGFEIGIQSAVGLCFHFSASGQPLQTCKHLYTEGRAQIRHFYRTFFGISHFCNFSACLSLSILKTSTLGQRLEGIRLAALLLWLGVWTEGDTRDRYHFHSIFFNSLISSLLN